NRFADAKRGAWFGVFSAQEKTTLRLSARGLRVYALLPFGRVGAANTGAESGTRFRLPPCAESRGARCSPRADREDPPQRQRRSPALQATRVPCARSSRPQIGPVRQVSPHPGQRVER